MLLVDFINVGYGDSILLREMAGNEACFAMLVDCGDVDPRVPHASSPRTGAAAYLRALGVRRLDLLVLSHLHLDHVGGMTPLLEALEVDALWTNYLPGAAFGDARPAQSPQNSRGANNLIYSMQCYLPALRQLREQGCGIRLVQQSLPPTPLGKALRVQVSCAPQALYARQDAALARLLRQGDAAEMDDLDGYINDTSIRLQLEYRGYTLCLPGDATAPFWAKTPPAPCDVLKVPHHGHLDSVNEVLLQALRPSYAVVSVSNDRADCPVPAAMALLQSHAPCVRFTDAVALPGFPPAPARQAVRFIIHAEGILEAE